MLDVRFWTCVFCVNIDGIGSLKMSLLFIENVSLSPSLFLLYTIPDEGANMSSKWGEYDIRSHTLSLTKGRIWIRPFVRENLNENYHIRPYRYFLSG